MEMSKLQTERIGKGKKSITIGNCRNVNATYNEVLEDGEEDEEKE